MQFGLKNGQRIEAHPGASALCPVCNSKVIAKCGEIKVWHWAHEVTDCDKWHETESAWHRNWKSIFPKNLTEVIIGNHRADIKVTKGVIELQNSSISSYEIEERESFYGSMIWVVNGEDWNIEPYYEWHSQNCIKNKKLNFEDQNEKYPHFRRYWPRKSWLAAKKRIYLDFNDDDFLYLINKFYGEGRYFTTKRINKQKFIRSVLNLSNLNKQISSNSSYLINTPTKLQVGISYRV